MSLSYSPVTFVYGQYETPFTPRAFLVSYLEVQGWGVPWQLV